MKVIRSIICFCSFFILNNSYGQSSDSIEFARHYKVALTQGRCYENLRLLCKQAPYRISGSPAAEKAVLLMEQIMKSDMGFDSVWLQPVMVPHWIRGDKERAMVNHPTLGLMNLNITALGGSVATPETGVTAKIIMIDSLSQLEKLGQEIISGNIIFFNRPMDPTEIFTFKAYGGAVDQRWAGPSLAAKYGAVATICRSMEVGLSNNPHTGSMRYDTNYKKIPCVAISTIDANKLKNWLIEYPNLTVNLELSCQTLPDVLSYNVIGQINGGRYPNEIILIGGHLDCWDNGEGAHDDGAGVVQSIEIGNIYKQLNIRPSRTIRAVLFMNEENGLRGGKKYAELAKLNKEKHIAAIESDEGGFTPRGFGISCDSNQWNKIQSWIPLFKPYWVTEFEKGGGGADIGPLKEQGVATIGYIPDPQRYFDYHHTQIDKFENVNKRELELGAAAIFNLVWLMSEYGF